MYKTSTRAEQPIGPRAKCPAITGSVAPYKGQTEARLGKTTVPRLQHTHSTESQSSSDAEEETPKFFRWRQTAWRSIRPQATTLIKLALSRQRKGAERISVKLNGKLEPTEDEANIFYGSASSAGSTLSLVTQQQQ